MKSGNLINSFNGLYINQSRIRFAVVTKKNSYIPETYNHKDFILNYAGCPPHPTPTLGQLQLHPCCLQSETQPNRAASFGEINPSNLGLDMTRIPSTHTALAKANHMAKPAINGVEEEHHREGGGMSGHSFVFSITLWLLGDDER